MSLEFGRDLYNDYEIDNDAASDYCRDNDDDDDDDYDTNLCYGEVYNDNANLADLPTRANTTGSPKSYIGTAIRKAMPDGFFKRPVRNILTVSMQLDIGYRECLYLREFLGADKFHKLLITHGLVGKGEQTSSPIEYTWSCPCFHSAGEIPALPCRHPSAIPTIYLGMGSIQDHVFQGWYMCANCQRRMPQRELQVLGMMETSGIALSAHQVDRLALLRKWAEDHRQRNLVTPDIRKRQRTVQTKRKRKATPLSEEAKKTKKIGTFRFITDKNYPMYPAGLIQKMTRGIKAWIKAWIKA